MNLVPAKCPECGGSVKVDRDKKAAICEYCGTPFIVEEAINNYITNNIIVEDQLNRFWVIEGTTLVKYNGASRIVTVPNNVTEIATGAIIAKEHIEELTIPSTVKYISPKAISAKKVIVEDNPDLNFGGDGKKDVFVDLDELVFKGNFGNLAKLYRRETRLVYFLDKTEEEVLSAFKDYDNLMTSAFYKGEERKVFNHDRMYRENEEVSASYCEYLLDKDGNATIVDWKKPTFYSVDAIVDFSKIEGHKIVGFRGYAHDKFLYELFRTSFSYFVKEIRLPEGLNRLESIGIGDKYPLKARTIYLPSTIVIIDNYVLGDWDEVIIPKEANIKVIAEKAVDIDPDTKLAKKKIEVPKHVPNAHYKMYNYFSIPKEEKNVETTDSAKAKPKEKVYTYEIYLEGKGEFWTFASTQTNGKLDVSKSDLVQGKNIVKLSERYIKSYNSDKHINVFKGEYGKGKIVGSVYPSPKVNRIKSTLFGAKVTQD